MVLDGVEFRIIRDRSTANLAFVAGKLDWIATTLPLSKDIKSQEPGAICEVMPGGISRNLIINRDAPQCRWPTRPAERDLACYGYCRWRAASQPLRHRADPVIAERGVRR